MSRPVDTDVLILGAGPTGSVAALNLAPTRRVILVERRVGASPRIGEALPPTARRLLTDMDLLDGFLAEGHTPCYGNRAVWGRYPGGNRLHKRSRWAWLAPRSGALRQLVASCRCRSGRKAARTSSPQCDPARPRMLACAARDRPWPDGFVDRVCHRRRRTGRAARSPSRCRAPCN
ncbi:MAG: FAD-dependent monooxygenase [Alphaproteobacteria bacterium]|nr:FAD-dependent monooxygenase [Alphaproteobacteria bacterium]